MKLHAKLAKMNIAALKLAEVLGDLRYMIGYRDGAQVAGCMKNLASWDNECEKQIMKYNAAFREYEKIAKDILRKPKIRKEKRHETERKG